MQTEAAQRQAGNIATRFRKVCKEVKDKRGTAARSQSELMQYHFTNARFSWLLFERASSTALSQKTKLVPHCFSRADFHGS